MNKNFAAMEHDIPTYSTQIFLNANEIYSDKNHFLSILNSTSISNEEY